MSHRKRKSESNFTRYYGRVPRLSYADIQPIEGTLRVADHALVFRSKHEILRRTILFEAMRWVGIHEIETDANAPLRYGFVVHYLDEYRYAVDEITLWRMATFLTPDEHLLLSRLSAAAGLPQSKPKWTRPRDDFGPFPVTLIEQDVYGNWHPIRYDTVYVTPAEPHLLLMSAFRVDQALGMDQLLSIQVLDPVVAFTGHAPDRSDILQLTYADVLGERQVLWYALPQAEALADTLAIWSGVAYEVVGRRKKKQIY